MDRDEAYASLSDLIFKGFLTAELNLDGELLILKTISDKEYDLIKVYSGKPNQHSYQVRFNIYFLILSLFMLNNKNMLCEREKNLSELFDYFINLPNNLVKKMLSKLDELRVASYASLNYLEGFSYTGLSRSAWKVLSGNFPCRTEFTGIPGTTNMGLNVHQGSWILINKALDEEDNYNRDFSLSLMVASASNPKGCRHTRNQFDSSKKMSDDRKNKLAKEGFIDVKKWHSEGWAAPVDTAEELVAELQRQMTGVKDKHDEFMENYMDQIRLQAEKKTKEAEDRIKKYQESHDNVFIDGDSRAMTLAEMNELKFKKTPTTVSADEEILTPEDKNKFYSKIGAQVLTAK